MTDATYFAPAGDAPAPPAGSEDPLTLAKPLAYLAAGFFMAGFWGCLGVEALLHRIG
jgi:hypothetical protein